jgi:LDH2 family malate/lactate/ureidoglycolate dehydrogenase
MDTTYAYSRLYDFSKNIFLKVGFSPGDAETATNTLLSADLRGVDSHGISRLTGYVRLCEAGRIEPRNSPAVIHETPSTGVVDGNAGLGLVVAPYAMKIAISKARAVGSGWISVQNSSHFGIAGIHAMMALEHDMIGIVMTNASPIVAPTFSVDKLLGTNPICVAIPAGKEAPFVADFATTTAANGKLELLQRKDQPAPNGWVQTKNGSPSTDAGELKKGGALLPLGGDRDHGSHKGYMLGSIVDIFSGVLSGANYGPFVPPFPAYLPMPAIMPGKGIGHFFGAMRIDGFRPAADFKVDMDNWIQQFKNAKVAGGFDRVIIPGEPEAAMQSQRMKEGIPLFDSVVEELNELGGRFGLVL